MDVLVTCQWNRFESWKRLFAFHFLQTPLRKKYWIHLCISKNGRISSNGWVTNSDAGHLKVCLTLKSGSLWQLGRWHLGKVVQNHVLCHEEGRFDEWTIADLLNRLTDAKKGFLQQQKSEKYTRIYYRNLPGMILP